MAPLIAPSTFSPLFHLVNGELLLMLASLGSAPFASSFGDLVGAVTEPFAVSNCFSFEVLIFLPGTQFGVNLLNHEGGKLHLVHITSAQVQQEHLVVSSVIET